MSELDSVTSSAREELEALEAEESDNVTEVIIDGLVSAQIVKHCRDNLPELVTGQLLGLGTGGELEVTNSYAFPSSADEATDNEFGAKYQMDMLRCLREVNGDYNVVGWYQTTYLGTAISENMVETQYNYQNNIKTSVVIVYDPLTNIGDTMSLRAYRLTDEFMELYGESQNSPLDVTKNNLAFSNVFQEIPVKIRNSHLVSAFLHELEEQIPAETITEAESERLNLSYAPFLEKNVEFLMECIEDFEKEQQKFINYQRNLSRQQYQQAQYLQKKKQEQANKRAAGLDVPEDDEDLTENPLFKPIPPPLRMDSLLMSNQITGYCSQVSQHSSSSLSKFLLAKSLHQTSGEAVARD